jgi:hypothetical protein
MAMNADFNTVIAANEQERRDLFVGAATRLGTAAQNVEKDFWVGWVLDALFNGLQAGGPRLLFKGGTSLSKAFGLISRFSEDIDITVFRQDLGQPVEVEELEALSGKKRRARLEEIRDACQQYLAGPLREQLAGIAATAIPEGQFKLEMDPDDKDGQSLLFWYPAAAVQPKPGDYIRSAVKIESGAKSALDPHVSASVTPYVAQDLPQLNLQVANITTVRPERTFWDKVMILHGLRQWHATRGELRHGGQRVSRHYYDVYRLMQADTGHAWRADQALAADCARHARMFFGSPDLGLETAAAGGFTLVPDEAMRSQLAKDYEAMAPMIFGDVPALADVLSEISLLEAALNKEAAASPS